MYSVEASGVWKKLGGRWVLRGVELRIPRSSLAVVLGPNGAGKTTLLRCITGIYRVERGSVRVEGLEPHVAARRGLLAYAPDEAGLYPRLTGREHIELVERVYGRLWSRVWDAADALGLTRVLDRRVSEYSRGMRRKLAMLMALASDAPLLLLDEPLTGLDLASIYAAIEILSGLASSGKTIIATTHEVWLAEKMATHVVVLEEGRVLAQGRIDELLSEAGAENLEQLLLAILEEYKRRLSPPGTGESSGPRPV